MRELCKIKSIVTLALTAVYCYLACTGKLSSDYAMQIFTTVIAFYFGTKYEKNRE